MPNDYDSYLKDLATCNTRGFRDALIDVADTMYACRVWLTQYGDRAQPIAADVIAMAHLVMERKRWREIQQMNGDC
jgi:hypothetical protein